MDERETAAACIAFDACGSFLFFGALQFTTRSCERFVPADRFRVVLNSMVVA
jgi:hypothetical protein